MTITPTPRLTLIGILKWERSLRIDTLSWTQADAPNTACWWCTRTELSVTEVAEDGISYGAMKASVVECQAEALSWYYDESAHRLYVHTTDGDTPSGNYMMIMRMAAYYSTHSPVVYAGRYCEPLLKLGSIQEIGQNVAKIGQAGFQMSFGTVKLNNANGYFDALLDTYVHEAGKMTLLLASVVLVNNEIPTLTDGMFSVVWPGWSGDIEWTDQEITVGTEDLRSIML